MEVGDRAGTSHRGQVALVVVSERAPGSAPEPCANYPGDVAALLHRHRGNAGKELRRSIGSDHAHHVADREDLGVTRKREIRAHAHPAGPVELGPGLLRELSGEL